MASSTAKKVVVHRFDREPLTGFVIQNTFLTADGVDFMTPAGKFQSVSYADIRYIAFVKDFDGDLAAERREFVARPKQEGLWVRMRFRDGQTQEGLAANNLLAIDAYGFTVAPPESSGNVQRLFVPRAAIEELKVLGVVGSPARRPAKQPKAAKPDTQIDLFS